MTGTRMKTTQGKTHNTIHSITHNKAGHTEHQPALTLTTQSYPLGRLDKFTNATSKIATSKTLVTSLALSTLVALSACQTLPSQSSQNATTHLSNAEAKAQLINAAQWQARHAFVYDTHFAHNNHAKLTALANATPEQLGNANSVYEICEHEHDTRYTALLESIYQQEVQAYQAEHGADATLSMGDVNYHDPSYDSQKQQLAEAYLACREQYDAWRDSRPDMPSATVEAQWSDEFGFEDTESTDDVLVAQDRSVNTITDEPTEQDPQQWQKFEQYDSEHTLSEHKKQQLYHAYINNNTAYHLSGEYRPLSGTFSITPSFTHQNDRLTVHANQPIYFDVKNDSIYLWADNAAMLNALLIDKQLGTNWQNTWLKFTLDDGTLPKGISKDMVKAYANAKQYSLRQEPANNFAQVTPTSAYQQGLTQLNDNHQATLAKLLPQTSMIIEYHQPQSQRDYSNYLTYKRFYDDMVSKYPQLIKPEADDIGSVDDVSDDTEMEGDLDINMMYPNGIYGNGGEHTDASFANDSKHNDASGTIDADHKTGNMADADSDPLQDEPLKIDAKSFLQDAFAYLNRQIKTYEEEHELSDIHDHSIPSHWSTDDSDVRVSWLGLDGKVPKWLLTRSFEFDLSDDANAGTDDHDNANANTHTKAVSDDPSIDALTVFYAPNALSKADQGAVNHINSLAHAKLLHLPADARVPTVHNSIDIAEYIETTAEKLKEDSLNDGEAFGFSKLLRDSYLRYALKNVE